MSISPGRAADSASARTVNDAAKMARNARILYLARQGNAPWEISQAMGIGEHIPFQVLGRQGLKVGRCDECRGMGWRRLPSGVETCGRCEGRCMTLKRVTK